MDKAYDIIDINSVPLEKNQGVPDLTIIQRSNNSSIKSKQGDYSDDESLFENSSSENKFNYRRIKNYRDKFSSDFLHLVSQQDFEFGLVSPAEILVKKYFQENSLVTKEWLNELYIQKYGNINIIIGILRVISHLDYDDISPQGTTMALAALAHKNVEVRECGIRSFENWGTLDCLEILKQVNCQEVWLAEYVSEIIQDLEEELT